jgi:Rieske Fe-S protein
MSDQIRPSRRAVLGTAAVAAATLAGAAGCSTYDFNPGDNTKKGPVSVPTSDIPVGGGKIYGDQQVVVTQPASGSFKAFSAICTHQGCTVANVANGTINCTCHGSQYSIEDGSVVTPATGLTKQTQRPLPAKTIVVASGQATVS